MSKFRVLFVYPNQRTETLVPPSIAIFSALLKQRGYTVDLFDSTHYDLDADDYINTYFTNTRDDSSGLIQNLLVRPYESKAETLQKHISAVEGLKNKVEEFKRQIVEIDDGNPGKLI